jgi:hypothetical protein
MLTLADGRARGKVLFRFLRDMGNWGSRVAVNHLSLTGEVRFLDHALGVVENSLDVASSDRTQPPTTLEGMRIGQRSVSKTDKPFGACGFEPHSFRLWKVTRGSNG